MSNSKPSEKATLAVSPLTKNDRLSFLVSVKLALGYHGSAQSSFRQGAVFGALCGLELKWMKLGCKHGDWEPFCEKHFGDAIPERTARYYMTVAEGLKVKARRAADGEITFAPPKADLDAFLAKHQAKVAAGRLVQLTGHFERRYSREVWALLQTPAHKLTDVQRTRLAAAVESIADGETMSSLIEAYRISKRATGSGAKGGYSAGVGYALNLAGGRAEWASMAALIVSETVDVDSGTTQLTFGPAEHLGAADYLQLLKIGTPMAGRASGPAALATGMSDVRAGRF